jgi:hypothetical protein
MTTHTRFLVTCVCLLLCVCDCECVTVCDTLGCWVRDSVSANGWLGKWDRCNFVTVA